MNPVPDHEDPDLTIVLLGHSGVGKSASGNHILGRTAFESQRSSKSVTTEISEDNGTVFGKHISVVDTPGILGSEAMEIKGKCQQLLRLARPCLFLLVVKLDRFTEEQRRAANKVIQFIEGRGFETCFLLFTGADGIGSMTLDEFINDDPEGPLKEVVYRFGGRVHLFNNSNGGPEQVRDLLVKSGHLQNDVCVEARRMVLLGLPGAGKSSTGNTILRSQPFVSACSPNPVSVQTVSGSARVEGRQLTVVDTPGLTSKGLSPRKLFYEIMRSIQEAQPGPHAFIIVVPLDRITEVQIKMFKIVQKLFGRDALKFAMVLFTHGDRLGGCLINDFIQANTDLSKLLTKCGGRFCVFDNTETVNRGQVRVLLVKIDEMVAAYSGEHYTSEMFSDIQGFPVTLYIKWKKIRQWFSRKLREIDAARETRARRGGRNDAEAQGLLSEIN